MEPLIIRMHPFEVKVLHEILSQAYRICQEAADHQKPNLTSGVIILAEFFPTWRKKYNDLPFKRSTGKPPTYKLPISVAQIVHFRLQNIPMSEHNQWFLKNLDLALVNRSLVPAKPKPIA